MPQLPLEGVRILELGSLIAGPFATRILADFGADVIKVEPPGQGDPLREWGYTDPEHGSLWAMVQSRNKRSVSVDMRVSEGREIVRKLALQADVLIENFRPGRMEEWGLGFEDLKVENPKLVMVRISGYGQTGPYAQRPGFGNIAESMGGIRFVTGWADRPPLRMGLSIGDSIAALWATVGLLTALRHAERTGEGQVVDVALTEAVFSMMESILPEYGHDQRVRERTGNTLSGAAPTNSYLTKDDRWVSIGANADNIFRRLCKAMGRPEMADDPRYQGNRNRVQHIPELDEVIGGWVRERPLDEVMDILNEAAIPAGPVYSIADIAADPQYQAREMLLDVPDERVGSILMPGVVPKLQGTPGSVRSNGPALGAHTAEVLRELLGMDDAAVERLRDSGVIES